MIKRVLIVDDIRANLYMLETLLKGYGFDVISAENGKDALDKARLNPPDILITDILMPVMDGYALCRQWKSDDKLKQIPLVFYTATYTDPKDEEFALSLGADRFILKPQEPDIFINMLKEVLGEKYTARQVETKPLGEEMEFFKQYNEILFKKLEKKVTDLEIANQNAKILEDKYRSLFDHLQDAILLTKPDGSILAANKAACEMFGRSADEIRTVGRNGLVDVTDPRLQTALEERSRTGMARAEITMLRANGEKFPADITSTIFTDMNGQQKTSIIIRDITEQKRTEDTLRKSEARFRSYFELPLIGIAITSLEKGWIEVNNRLSDILGYSAQELKGMSWSELTYPEDLDADVEQFNRVLAGEIDSYMIDKRFIRKDGAVIWISLAAGCVRKQDGTVDYFVALLEDISVRKVAEEELLKSRMITENIPVGLYLYHLEDVSDDRTLRMIYANPVVKVLTGLGPEDVVGRTLDENFPGLRAQGIPQRYAEVVRSQTAITYEDLNYGDNRVLRASFSVRAFPLPGNHVGVIFENIVDRKRAEEALRGSERKLKDIIAFLPDATLAIDRDKRIIVWNKAIEEMTGIPASEMIGQGDYAYTVPFYGERRPQLMDLVFEDSAETAARYPAIARQGDTLTIEVFCNALNSGRGAWVFAKASPLYDASGRIIGAIEIIRDITDRKQAEEALKKLSLRQEALLTAIPDILMEVDANKVYSWANPAGYEFFGHDVIGRDASDFFVGNQDTYSMVQPLFNGDESVIYLESWQRRKDGEKRLLAWWCRVLKDGSGRTVGALSTARDITDRKQAEDALRRNEKDLRESQRIAHVGSWRLDVATNQVVWTEELYNMYGFDPSLPPPPYTEHMKLFAPESWERLSKALDRTRDTGIPYTLELETVRKDGSNGWMWVHGQADVDSTGKTVGLWGAAQDITERKRAEEKRRELEDRLQRSEKMEALGTLAGGVAHDLNNVLGVVLGYSELLASSLETSSPLQSQVEKIMKGTERAAEIVQDLLALARRGVQTRSPVSINDVIMNFLKSPEYERILLCNPRMRVNTDLQADILNMMGSKIHLHKTMMNLVSNASDAMSEGGRLSIKTFNQYLDRAISGYDHVREGDYVVLSVSDTGEGISSDDIRHIFEPFYTKKVMGRSGTGLGLAVVWGTVKDHEGYIDVQSEMGKGTTFDLYFPVTREMVSDEKIPVSLSDYMGKGESVLVIDDVKGQRDLASEMLSRLNYKVASVPSGEAAVEYLKANRADILVLDMIMDPGMDGLDTYKEILKLYPGQKAVIVSGFSETDRVKKAHRLGAGAYIRKPYAMERLGLAVRRELDKK